MEIVTHWYDRITRYLIQLLNVQLALLLVALPILMAWGLPISVLTLIATPLFSPFLSLFLFISSLIFFALQIGLTPSLLVLPLDWITDTWLFLLSFSSPDWLFGFVMVHPVLFVGLTLVHLILVIKSIMWRPQFRLFILTTYFCVLTIHLFGLKILAPTRTELLREGERKIKLLMNDSRTIVIDEGFFARKRSARSWVLYTFLPDLLKRTGSRGIDFLILTQLSKQVLQVCQILIKEGVVRQIFFPFNKKITSDENVVFVSFLDSARNNSVIVHCVRGNVIQCFCGAFILALSFKKQKIYVAEQLVHKERSVWPPRKFSLLSRLMDFSKPNIQYRAKFSWMQDLMWSPLAAIPGLRLQKTGHQRK